jgi:plastocyanin
MAVPAGHLRDVLGVTEVRYLRHHKHLAIVDDTLSGAAAAAAMADGEAHARAAVSAAGTANASAPSAAGSAQIGIDNFAFTPRTITTRVGQPVTWTNHDDVPHRIQSSNQGFAPSGVLDTKGAYSVTLATAGEYPYFCSLHPTMTGKILVK